MTANHGHPLCNPLTPRVKTRVKQSFLTFDSMDKTPKSLAIHWKAVEQYLIHCSLFFVFTQLVILENLSILDLAMSRVKGIIEMLLTKER